MDAASVYWNRLDCEGHDRARYDKTGGGWTLTGSADYVENAERRKLDYRVMCDSGWRVMSARVSGLIGEREIAINIDVDDERRWSADSEEYPLLNGAMDLNLGFTPLTHTIAINRLALPVAGEAHAPAAWLNLDSLTLEPLGHRYRRLADASYYFETDGNRFSRKFTVDAAGFVTSYPGIWKADLKREPGR